MNTDMMSRLLEIGIALVAEEDSNRLLEQILQVGMEITRADAGTLYLYDGNVLRFKIMRNNTLKTYEGGDGAEVSLPPVPMSEGNVCAYAAIKRKMIIIDDVKQNKAFDFSGPARYDAITGYDTRSMLVVPMENNSGNLIGVLQLLNAGDSEGKVVSFDGANEQGVKYVASIAAEAVTKMNHAQEMENLFNSFVQVLADAIDKRTPYNSNHSNNVARFTDKFIDHLNRSFKDGKYNLYFDEKRKRMLILGAWLHDIGKLVIPLDIMDKETKLGPKLDNLLLRLELNEVQNRIEFMSGLKDAIEWQSKQKEIADARLFIMRVNFRNGISEEELRTLESIRGKVYYDSTGHCHNWLSDQEVAALSIRSGTLTDEEREIMQSHVVVTGEMLSAVDFSKDLLKVRSWAASHHELIDGSGYPKGLEGDQIPVEARILSLVDIFEALTAKDRPYRKKMTVDQALLVLSHMVEDGKLDSALFHQLKESKVWEQ